MCNATAPVPSSSQWRRWEAHGGELAQNAPDLEAPILPLPLWQRSIAGQTPGEVEEPRDCLGCRGVVHPEEAECLDSLPVVSEPVPWRFHIRPVCGRNVGLRALLSAC